MLTFSVFIYIILLKILGIYVYEKGGNNKLRKLKLIYTVIMLILFYFILSLIPVGSAESYAADMSAGTLSRDVNAIDDTLYPGYKKLINDLKAKNSNYTFLIYYTGMDWNEVLNAEYQGHGDIPLNLFQVGTKYNGMWMCPLCSNKAYDNGSWCCASKEALAYMMDPRNSINESDVFQFKDLEYSDVTYEDIARVVSDCGAFLNNQEAIQAIVDASKEYRINGFYLVAKIINEHGKNGSVLSNGQGYGGQYVGVYNYFNIKSWGNGQDTIIRNGLSYAQSQGWTSIRASIFGGAKEIRESYITKYSQNTLYYQKFNVSGRSTMASHQYQQNIMAAQTQGTSLKSYYANTNKSHTFIIPLYRNIPATVSVRPDVSKTNTIKYENGIIKNVTSSLGVRVAPNVNAVETGRLNGEETIKIIQRASSTGANGYYWDLIVSDKLGIYGYAARIIGGDECIVSLGTTGSSSGTAGSGNTTTTPETPTTPTPSVPSEGDKKIKIEGDKFTATPTASIETIKSSYANAVIKNSKGEVVTSGNFATGFVVTIEGKDYTVVKKGDVNGDGNANIVDAIGVLNHLKGTNILNGVYLESAKVNGNSKINITDVVSLLNYIKGTANIEI